MSMKPGIYTIPPADYHSDPSDEPSLSASTAKVLLSRSPLHAWTQHPRNPAFEREEDSKFDLGTAVHDVFLEGGERVAVIEGFCDWRTKASQTARDAAREVGLVPLLEKDWARVQDMITAIRRQLAERDDRPPLFAGGKPEQTLVWQENGIWCRAMLDWLHDSHRYVDDLKTTSASAHPADWCDRTLWNIGADVQVAFHLRGIKAVTGKTARLRYVVVESSPPYALKVVTLAPSALELGRRKVDTAFRLWRECLESGRWPAYDQEVEEVESTTRAEADFLERHWQPPEEATAA